MTEQEQKAFEQMQEALGQMIACHDEPTCPAISTATEALAAANVAVANQQEIDKNSTETRANAGFDGGGELSQPLSESVANAVHCGYDETTGNCTHNPCCRADHTDALLFAEILERPGYGWHSTPEKVAAELRRQHKEIKALKDALFQMQNAAKAIAKKLTAANAVQRDDSQT